MLMTLWFDKSNRNKDFYIGNKVCLCIFIVLSVDHYDNAFIRLIFVTSISVRLRYLITSRELQDLFLIASTGKV